MINQPVWRDENLPAPGATLRGDVDCDVAIVGAGFTGLWTARELLRRDPALQIVLVDAHHVGFGASSRNGGWASALFPVAATRVVSQHGLATYQHLSRFLRDAVIDLAGAIGDDGLDCDFHRGGTVTFGRSELQRARLLSEVEEAHQLGQGEMDLTWLEAEELVGRFMVAGAIGATFSPHCARLQPARLVQALAVRVRELGATIWENSPVTRIVGGRGSRRAMAVTASGTIRAEVIVRATEGYSTSLGVHRDVVPIYSMMIASEPLSNEWWSQYGFDDAPTFADGRHLIIYGQRTADNRLAFGGRGAPYHFGSTVDQRFDVNVKVFDHLANTVRELFPDFSGSITHQWGGPLAMPRDRYPRVALDRTTGLACAGGYTGDGVTMSFVAARLLAQLICDPDSEDDLRVLPFVQRPLQRWEIEPLRYLGINAGLSLATWADFRERQGRSSRASAVLERLLT